MQKQRASYISYYLLFNRNVPNVALLLPQIAKLFLNIWKCVMKSVMYDCTKAAKS